MSDRRRDLEHLRSQMAEIDADIVRALQKRARLAMQLQEHGGGSVPPLSVTERELGETIEAIGGTDVAPEAVRAVLREVRAATTAVERNARVALPGPEGDFVELAARRQFGASVRAQRAAGVAEAIEEVVRGRADCALVPFESSRDGTRHDSIDLIADSDVLIAAKVEVAARLSLMIAPAADRGLAQRVVFVYAGHRMAVQRLLAEPSWTVREVTSPAAAAQAATDALEGAALVPEPIGEAMGLVALRSNVGDRADLRYRFAAVSTRPTFRTGHDTTAILCGVHDRPDGLFNVLARFAERGLHMKSIQSMAMAGGGGPARMYVEVSGHVADRAVVTAIEQLKQSARFVKVLGSFPAC